MLNKYWLINQILTSITCIRKYLTIFIICKIESDGEIFSVKNYIEY